MRGINKRIGGAIGYHLGTGTDPLQADTDGDGLSDGDEINIHGTSPHDADTDGDGMTDDEEAATGSNPLVPDAGADPDADGLANEDELIHGTDPNLWNTDNDGVSDGDEVAQDSDPNDPNDSAPPPSGTKDISFNIYGDWAVWRMTIESTNLSTSPGQSLENVNSPQDS
jgi:hypothetical protein